jgi:stage II sporulation protein AA (anti-sigma F factor antagonist)
MTSEDLRGHLLITTSVLGGHTLATLTGEVDFSTQELLHDRLSRALARTRTALIVDLANVGFCDSSGLGAFIRLTLEASVHGVTLVLVGVHGRVAGLLATTRMDVAFYIRSDVEAAIRWLDGGSMR